MEKCLSYKQETIFDPHSLGEKLGIAEGTCNPWDGEAAMWRFWGPLSPSPVEIIRPMRDLVSQNKMAKLLSQKFMSISNFHMQSQTCAHMNMYIYSYIPITHVHTHSLVHTKKKSSTSKHEFLELTWFVFQQN